MAVLQAVLGIPTGGNAKATTTLRVAKVGSVSYLYPVEHKVIEILGELVGAIKKEDPQTEDEYKKSLVHHTTKFRNQDIKPLVDYNKPFLIPQHEMQLRIADVLHKKTVESKTIMKDILELLFDCKSESYHHKVGETATNVKQSGDSFFLSNSFIALRNHGK